MKNKVLAVFVTLLALSLTASAFAASVGDPAQYNFMAGQTIDIGRIEVSNDGTNLYVALILEDSNWQITQTHVAVATAPGLLPQNGAGNPKVGQFPYSGLLSYTIPLAAVGADAGDTLYVAVHAVVQGIGGDYFGQEETAWGQGCPHTGTLGGDFPGNSWATYLIYAVT
jgi:hypothetical protein